MDQAQCFPIVCVLLGLRPSHCALAGLLHPSATIMDVNIGAALWMAARAEGKLTVVRGSAAADPPLYGAQELQEQMPMQQDQQLSGTAAGQTITQQQQQQQQQQEKLQQKQNLRPSHKGQGSRQQDQGAVQRQQGFHLQYQAQEPLQQAVDCTSQAEAQQQRTAQQQQEPTHQEQGLTDQQGHGQTTQLPSSRQGWYCSAARVVLLGHGADEQHAGYGRHRTSFRTQVGSSSLQVTQC